ncbi:hypothetical protein ACIHJG_38455 [Streptomyces sp. NPDC052415]|uniref:hypothetical protein n=1 Tax=Streptomyces sp. NPDC052415 TaxID=3365690 RepID=UPI0037D0AB37
MKLPTALAPALLVSAAITAPAFPAPQRDRRLQKGETVTIDGIKVDKQANAPPGR